MQDTTQEGVAIGLEAAEAAPVMVPWAQATMADLAGFNVNDVVTYERLADVTDIHFKFDAAIQEGKKSGQASDAWLRVMTLIHGVTGLRLTPDQPHAPFRIMIMIEGNRSADLSDFGPDQIEVLGALAQQAQHPGLRARFADAAWMLARKRVEFAVAAVEAYVAAVRGAMDGELEFFAQERGALDRTAAKYLQRALSIGRITGWDTPTTTAARDTAIELRKLATKATNPVPLIWFSDLDMTFRLSEPADIAADIEKALGQPGVQASTDIISDLWRLAAQAYHAAKRDDDKHRCQALAAERFVTDAEAIVTKKGSAMLAAHLMGTAISRLHGIPGQRNRRNALRHRLIDIQANIIEEMQSHTFDFDPTPYAKATEEAFVKLSLRDKLFRFALLTASPDPEELIKAAKQSVKDHPLSSLFGTSHLDHEGKTVHKTGSGGFGEEGRDGAVTSQIAQTESIRRNLVVASHIDPARQATVNAHYLNDDLLVHILQYSAFVPEDLVGTFARGFLRFFQGDFVSALYILTPLLENSLRYVLRQQGHDVTIFDDATQIQEDRTISALYEQMRPEMEAIFTKAVVADIERVFLTKVGPHLRHSVAHGLTTDGTPYGPDAVYGCWLMYRLALLPIIAHRDEISLDFGWLG